MLWYKSFKAGFMVSTGKERLESSFLIESKNNLILRFVLLRYNKRLIVNIPIKKKQIIEKRKD
jgi:hypothetical protein